MFKSALVIIGTVAAVGLGAKATLAADAAAGEDVFKKKCSSCHSVEEGQHKTGPSLAGVVGRKAGSTDFGRYKGLVDVDFVWDEVLLDAYITDPKAFVQEHTANKSTSMTFKLKDEAQRADVIEFLKTQ